VLGNSLLRQFDSSHEIRGGVAAAAEALGPGAMGPVQVTVTFPDGGASSSAHGQALAAIRQEMEHAPDIASVAPPVFADDNNSAMLSAMLSVDPEDLGARKSIDWMRNHLSAVPGAGSARVDVGGPTALIKDFDGQVSMTEPLVLAFVALIAFVMLLLSIQSVFLAFKGVLMTVLSVAAAYGSLVMVFQWGWLEKLGFAPISSIDSTVPPLVLAMTFGLSMDYEIFLLTRIRERFLQSGDTHDAVAYGVSTSARTITSAALIMIAVFIGFAFAGMPLVAEIGVACAVAIAVDATVVRLVMVPALMAMFDEWNWWLPAWLSRTLPSVDFEKPLPMGDLGGIVIIPDDIGSAVVPSADLRIVLKSAAKLKLLVPDAICVTDPLAFTGCERNHDLPARVVPVAANPEAATERFAVTTGALGAAATNGQSKARKLGRVTGGLSYLNGAGRATPRTVHPVTLWRGRLSVALDALDTEVDTDHPRFERRSPVETTHVQLPTGDRLQIPTGAETLRLKGYLIMCRNSSRDYVEFAELVDAMEAETAAVVLAGMDRYYCCQSSKRQWIATQLVRRLADPHPADLDDERYPEPDTKTDWDEVRHRCLSVAVAMLEEAR
jgi:RND superfamily putative drug exporter